MSQTSRAILETPIVHLKFQLNWAPCVLSNNLKNLPDVVTTQWIPKSNRAVCESQLNHMLHVSSLQVTRTTSRFLYL